MHENTMLKIGRAAARILPDGRVEVTEFIRVSPDDENCDRAAAEASWSSAGGGVFTETEPTGTPCGLDNRGMHSARMEWHDFINTFRIRLELLERKHGKSGFTEYSNTVSAGFGFPPPVRSALTTALVAELRILLTSAFSGAAEEATTLWRERLPQTRLALMRNAGWNSSSEWNWLNAEECEHRLQGVRAFPWAASVMRKNMDVFRVLENRKPLVPVLSNVFGMPPPVVRRLNGMPYPSGGFVGLAEAAALLPTSPGTEHGWKCWQAAVRVFRNGHAIPNCRNYDSLPSDFPELMKSVPDMLADIYHTVLQPFGIDAAEEMVVFSSLEDCAIRLQNWETDNGAAATMLREAYPAEVYAGNNWLPLHEPFETGYGLTAVPLCNDAALLEEGRRMQHCVSSYGPSCRVSGCHIVSFRNSWGESVGTAEISQRVLFPMLGTLAEAPAASRMLPAAYVQFKGKRNASPPDSAWMALHAHAAALLTGMVKPDTKALDDAMTLRKSMSGNLRAVRDMNAGYNTGAPGALRSALRLYTPFISPGAVKKLEKTLRRLT